MDPQEREARKEPKAQGNGGDKAATSQYQDKPAAAAPSKSEEPGKR
jgi:hypothetical protein